MRVIANPAHPADENEHQAREGTMALAAMPDTPGEEEIQERVLAVLDDMDAPPPAENDRPWRINTEKQAVWAVRQLARARRLEEQACDLARHRIDKIKEAIAPEIAAVEEWLGEELDRLGKQQETFETLLMIYHRSVLEDDEDQKTIRLPNGVLKSRKQQDRWEITENKFIPWAEKHAPFLLRRMVSVDRLATKDGLEVDYDGRVVLPMEDTDGLSVPGVTVTPMEPKFTIDTEGVTK